MSLTRTVVIDPLTYTFCPDAAPPRGNRLQALVLARCIDEMTGAPLNAQVQATTTVPGIQARASTQGVVGLIGNPMRRFPGLRDNAVELDLSVRARRYLPMRSSVTIGPINTGNGAPLDFPDHFAAIDLGELPLHREATQIIGRCMIVQSGKREPLDGALVSFDGIWHRFPAADEDPMTVVEAPNILALTQGLYAVRDAGVAQIQACDLVLEVGADKRVLNSVAAGSTRVRISDRVNLAIGNVVALQPDDAERAEYLEIVGIEGAGTDLEPAMLKLAHPLRREHRVGARVVRVDVQNLGVGNTFTRAGIPGDQTLFLAALNQLDGLTACISGGAANEYHRIHRYRAVSDAEGHFRLPPLSRVAMVQLIGSHPSPVPDVDLSFSPDYERDACRVDLVFS